MKSCVQSGGCLWKALQCGNLLPGDAQVPAPLFELEIEPWWNEYQAHPTPQSVFVEFLGVWEALEWKWVAGGARASECQAMLGVLVEGLCVIDACVEDSESTGRALKADWERTQEREVEIGKLRGETRTFIDVLDGLPPLQQ